MGTATIASKNNQATHLVGAGVKLPFPTSIQVDTEYNWSAEEMGIGADLINAGKHGDIGGDLKKTLERAGLKIGEAVGGNAFNAYMHNQKQALNPKETVLFRGVNHRSFSLTWELVPTTRAESTAFANAITQLHEMAAPGGTDSSTFFTYPETTKIKITKSDGANIIDRPNCAITSISVDMTPDGVWAQLSDGRPVHTTLTVAFTELTLPTKNNVPKLLG